MSDLINREELLKQSHTVVVEDMWHMHQEIEVVNVDDIKKLQPQEEPLVIIRYSDKCENCSEILNNLVNERLEHMWIPISERLPEDGEYVLGQSTLGGIDIYQKNKEIKAIGICGGWFNKDGNWYSTKFVVAWMPLPKPYKGDEK